MVRSGVALTNGPGVGLPARVANGGAVAAMVGTPVGVAPGTPVGVAVRGIRVSVAVGWPATNETTVGTSREEANNPSASSPKTIAIPNRIADGTGIPKIRLGRRIERGLLAGAVTVSGIGSRAISATGTRTVSVIAVGSGASLSGGGSVSGGRDGGGDVFGIGSTGFFGLGEGGANGNRRRRSGSGTDDGKGVDFVGSGGGWTGSAGRSISV